MVERKITPYGIVFFAFYFFWNLAHAGTPIHGAKAGGMAAAFVAVCDDPSAILHNPAGIANLEGTRLYGGATAVTGSVEFENSSGQTEEAEDKFYFPPHAYATSDFNLEKMTFGLGLYSPFGIGGRELSDDGLTRYLSTENLISTFSVNPVFAYRIIPQAFIGFGVFYLYASNEAERMIDQSALGHSDGRFSMEGDGGGLGYNLGLLLFPESQISFGMTYRSKVDVDQDIDIRLTNLAPALHPLTGGSGVSFDAKTRLEFPEVLSFGLAYRPTDSLTLAVELEWTGWSSFDRADVDFENEIPQAGISDFVLDYDYDDTWFYKIGVDYKFTAEWSIRAGYAYVESPVPGRTLNPANPDADQHNFGLGVGYAKEKWHFDVFYMADKFEKRSVDNEFVNGEFETFGHFAGLSIGYRF